MIYLYIFLLMLFTWGLSFLTEYIPKRVLGLVLTAVAIVMIVVAATKPDTSSDYAHYFRMFQDYDSPKTELTTEPTYIMLSKFLHTVRGSFDVLLWIYALLSIPLKMYAFKRLSSYDILFAGLPIYYAFFFQLHDCEQIRLAAAMAFAMAAYVCRVEKRFWLSWVLLWLIATSFHYTTFVTIAPLVLYRSKPFSVKYRILLSLFVFAGIIIWFLHLDIISLIPIPALEAKMALYDMSIAQGEQIEEILLYHPIALLRYAVFFYALFFYDTLRQRMKGLNIILLCQAFGLFAWGGLSGVAVFAVRVSELYQIPEILLFGSVVNTVRPAWAGRVFVLAVALYIFMYGIRVNQFGFAS